MEKNGEIYTEPDVRLPSKKVRKGADPKACVLWLTGLSAAGKSTIANALCDELHRIGVKSYVLDGDIIRRGLNKDLGFGPEDRKENIRRIGEVARLFIDAGLIVIAAFISPYQEDRHLSRQLVKQDEFIEVFIKCPITECQRRDPKGMYKKAINGEIKEFTGISAPYEEPEFPEIILQTDQMSVDECIKKIMDYLRMNGYLTLL